MIKGEKNGVYVAREMHGVAGRISIKKTKTLWDQRYEVPADNDDMDVTFGVLGEDGWQNLSADQRDQYFAEPVPHSVKLMVPTFFNGGQVVAIPEVGYFKEGFEGLSHEFTPKYAW